MLYLPYSFMVVWEESLDPNAKIASVFQNMNQISHKPNLCFSASYPILLLDLAVPTSPIMKKQALVLSGTTLR